MTSFFLHWLGAIFFAAGAAMTYEACTAEDHKELIVGLLAFGFGVALVLV